MERGHGCVWRVTRLLLAEDGAYAQGSGKVLRVLSRTVTGSDSHLKKITGSAPFGLREAGRGSGETRRLLSQADCVDATTVETEGTNLIYTLWSELGGAHRQTRIGGARVA